VDSTAALDILGLDREADLAAVKHRFRRLAHDRHPDRGGDPRSFDDLQLAYRLLCRELGADAADPNPLRPRVARGRPSRLRRDPPAAATPSPSGRPARPLTALTAAELRSLREDRRHRLDAELLTRLLLAGPATGHAYRLMSRAPRGRGTQLSHIVSVGIASSLTVHFRTSDVRLELTARGRRARRLLAHLDLSALSAATWTRHRGDAVTVATCGLAVLERSEDGARRTVGAVVELLDALAWPLARWRVEPGAR